MKAQKKAERQHQKMLEWLKKNGKDTSTIEIEIPTVAETFTESHLEGQAVLAYWENGKTWQNKTCRTCRQVFATNYNSVDTCSMKCLKKAVEKLGLTWRPEKPAHERWGRTPPLVVPESARLLIDQMKQEQIIPNPQPEPAQPLTLEHPQDSDDSLESLDFEQFSVD